MKNVGLLVITLILFGFYSCKECPKCPVIETLSQNKDSSEHSHHELSNESIKSSRITEKIIKVKQLDNKYIYFEGSKVDSLITKGEFNSNYSIISNIFISSPDEIKSFWWSGKYGCYNNVIKLEIDEAVTKCDASKVYVKLDRLAVHHNGSHRRATEMHYLELPSDRLVFLNNQFSRNIENDLITNIKIDLLTPRTCSSGYKFFTEGDIEIIPISNH